MRLYRRVVQVLVPASSELPAWNGYWSILETIHDENKILEYINCKDSIYQCGAYISPTMANYNFDFEFYKEEN